MISVENKKIKWHKGMTISDILSQIEFGKNYSVVRLNGNLITKPYFDSTTIEDNSKIILIPMISGG